MPSAEGKGQTWREGDVEVEEVRKEELAGQPGMGTAAAAQSLQKRACLFFVFFLCGQLRNWM